MINNPLHKTFTIDVKDIVIVALLLFGGYHFLLTPKHIEEKEKQTTTIDIEKQIEEAINNRMQLQKPTKQPTIIYHDRVVPVYKETPIPEGDEQLVRNLNKYTDTTALENATIYSEILSDGTVYQNKVTAEIDVKTITNTIEKKIVKYGSGLYIGPEINVNSIHGIQNVGASIHYLHKGDLGIGLGAQYDFVSRNMSYGVRVFKKVF